MTDVGVTIYSTVPEEAPGLFNVCAMVDPVPLDAPVIPPVIVPIVHVKLLATLAVRGMLVAVAEQS